MYVIINLQTWVVLFDYLGIGIPTPPPSRSATPEPPPMTVPNEHVMTGSTHIPSVDRSLLEDALEFTSLGSDPSISLYRSAWQDLPSHDETAVPNQPSPENSLSPPLIDPLDGGEDEKSVWGVDGKMCVGVELSVKSLTVTFNKLEHPLARGNVSHVTAQLKLSRGNTEITGMLGEASVVDLTETGAYYRERCVCAVCCVLCAVCCVLCAVCCAVCCVCCVCCAVCCVLHVCCVCAVCCVIRMLIPCVCALQVHDNWRTSFNL